MAVVARYAARWSVETTFRLVQRLRDLAYRWVGSRNGVKVQVVAPCRFYAILRDRCADVAAALGLRLAQSSVEMT